MESVSASSGETYCADLEAEFAQRERDERRKLAALARAPREESPSTREVTDRMCAYRAVRRALRAAGLSGPLETAQLDQALKVLNGLRAGVLEVSDSTTVIRALAEAENACLGHVIRARGGA